ncbi:MAG: PHP domain-containing protein [Planctomycetota bacterium]
MLESLETEVPEGLLDLVALRGLGPVKVKTLYQKLGITTLGELEYACQENRLNELKGFGEKTQEKILKEIQLAKQYAGLFHLHYASHALEEVDALIRKEDGVIETATSGQVKRSLEVISRGELVVSCTQPEAFLDAVSGREAIGAVAERTMDCIRFNHPYGLPIDLHVVPPERFAARLCFTTGPAEHLALLEERARGRGYSLDRNGLFKIGSSQAEEIKDEAELYKALDLETIPPELREGKGEIDAAAERKLPALVGSDDLRGILHIHTVYSDGKNTLLEMADAAKAMGYAYIGVSDHSRTASYAGGLSIDQIQKQAREIKALNQGMAGFRILHGIESDILKDGSLDYPDKVLESLDFVIASVHSGFTMDEETMTQRIIKAIRHRATRILGHPTGRLLLGREPYAVDMQAVLEACAESRVMVEINANPHRLDIDWRLLDECRRLEIKVCINPDAHRVDGYHDIRFGIGIARRGGLGISDVANCLSAEELMDLWRTR